MGGGEGGKKGRKSEQKECQRVKLGEGQVTKENERWPVRPQNGE